MTAGTCLKGFGSACTGFGVESSFDSSLACCNRLFQIFSIPTSQGTTDIRQSLVGVCAPTANRRLLQQQPAKRWKLPVFDQPTTCADGSCEIRSISKVVTVPLYNSTSVLDDMAFGGVWLFKVC